MKTELIITATMTAIMTAVGLQTMSPELKQATDEIKQIASAQDAKMEYASFVSGKKYIPETEMTEEKIKLISEEIKNGAADAALIDAQNAVERFNQ